MSLKSIFQPDYNYMYTSNPQQTYNKSYKTKEQQRFRQKIFIENKRNIEERLHL